MVSSYSFKLRPYQIEGVKWFRERKRAWNTDSPGMGKTPQAVYAAERPVLVVCPNALALQWKEWLLGEDENSIERNGGETIANVGRRCYQNDDGVYDEVWFLPDTVVVATGNKAKRTKAIREHADWTIINEEMLYTYKDVLFEHNYNTLIIDESHHMRSRGASRAKMAVELGKRIPRVYMLTATPIWKEADDLYMQLRVLWPDIFTSYWQFVDKYCVSDQTRFGTKIYGIKRHMMPEIDQLLNVVRIGRTYEDVGRQLPPIIEKFVKIELPENVRKMYNEAVDQFRIEALNERFINYMQVYHTLRRLVTGTFKTEAVGEILADEVRRAVIFSWYKETAENIGQRLGDVEVVTGDDPVEVRRHKALGHKHVSATISSLMEGIDLSDARTCIFAEENWTPGSNYQALSRVRRERLSGNNDEPVVVYYVHCKNTIDEVIHRKSKLRSGSIKDVIQEALYL